MLGQIRDYIHIALLLPIKHCNGRLRTSNMKYQLILYIAVFVPAGDARILKRFRHDQHGPYLPANSSPKALNRLVNRNTSFTKHWSHTTKEYSHSVPSNASSRTMTLDMICLCKSHPSTKCYLTGNDQTRRRNYKSYNFRVKIRRTNPSGYELSVFSKHHSHKSFVSCRILPKHIQRKRLRTKCFRRNDGRLNSPIKYMEYTILKQHNRLAEWTYFMKNNQTVDASIRMATHCGHETSKEIKCKRNKHCLAELPGSICTSEGRCSCTNSTVRINSKKPRCVPGKNINEECDYSEQCVFLSGEHATCSSGKCKCATGFTYQNMWCGKDLKIDAFKPHDITYIIMCVLPIIVVILTVIFIKWCIKTSRRSNSQSQDMPPPYESPPSYSLAIKTILIKQEGETETTTINETAT